MVNWYVLFVKTGYEEQIIATLCHLLDSVQFKAFVLKKINLFIKARKEILEEMICFPGYVFIESMLEQTEVWHIIHKIVKENNNIYSLLYYGNMDEIRLSGHERMMLAMIFNDHYCLKKSTGIIENNNIIITEGALVGMESCIRKIDRHRRGALIELEVIGNIKRFTPTLEIAEKR